MQLSLNWHPSGIASDFVLITVLLQRAYLACWLKIRDTDRSGQFHRGEQSGRVSEDQSGRNYYTFIIMSEADE